MAASLRALGKALSRAIDWPLKGHRAAGDHQLRYLIACCYIGALSAVLSMSAGAVFEEQVALGVFVVAVLAIPLSLSAGLAGAKAKWSAMLVVGVFLGLIASFPQAQDVRQLYWFAVLPLGGGLILGRPGILTGGTLAVVLVFVVTWSYQGWDGLLAQLGPVLSDCLVFQASVMGMTAVYEGLFARALEKAERNLSAEARARQDALLSERKMRAVLDHEPACVKLVGRDGTLTDINPAGLRMFGVENIETIRGLRVQDVVTPETRPVFLATVEAAFSGETVTTTYEVTTRAGERLMLEQHSAPLYDDGGRVVAMLGVSRDVRERIEEEEQRLRDQRTQAIGTLAGGVAHDLNNVLTPIRLGVDELRDNDSQAEEVLEMMEGGIAHATDLLRQLLEFVRGAEGARTAVRLSALVSDLVGLLESSLPSDVELEVELDPHLPHFMADPTQLRQVLMNLCLNARDAMPEGGTLLVAGQLETVAAPHGLGAETARPGEYLVLRVQDTGIGISPEHQTEIFEPFYTTKHRLKGTGLGLATVLAIVRGHGGFVAVDSSPGQGTKISVYLPQLETTDLAASSTAPIRPPPSQRVLLVIDDETIRRGMARMLRQADFTVRTASDAREARLASEEDAPEVLITGARLPDQDGLSLARELDSLAGRLPVVVVCGPLENLTLDELDGGPVATVHKPFTRAELLDAIGRACAAMAALRAKPGRIDEAVS